MSMKKFCTISNAGEYRLIKPSYFDQTYKDIGNGFDDSSKPRHTTQVRMRWFICGQMGLKMIRRATPPPNFLLRKFKHKSSNFSSITLVLPLAAYAIATKWKPKFNVTLPN